MPVRTRKSFIVGHGIDTEKFSPNSALRATSGRPDPARVDRHHIVTVGRITKSKRLELIIGAFRSLPDVYRLTIVGAPRTPQDAGYLRHIQHLIDAGLNHRVTIRSIVHDDLPTLLRSAAAFVHASQTGLDKAVLEALACGSPVVSCSTNLPDAPGVERCSDDELAFTLRRVLESGVREPEASHGYVEREHGLRQFVVQLIEEMKI
jgi:glycosyltransferase involved in cell wall biosynthesis